MLRRLRLGKANRWDELFSTNKAGCDDGSESDDTLTSHGAASALGHNQFAEVAIMKLRLLSLAALAVLGFVGLGETAKADGCAAPSCEAAPTSCGCAVKTCGCKASRCSLIGQAHGCLLSRCKTCKSGCGTSACGSGCQTGGCETGACGSGECGSGHAGCGKHGCGHCGHCGKHGSKLEGTEFGYNCGCNGSYKYPVPPLSTYHWPGMFSHERMTDYHSPWRFPPLKPWTEEAPYQRAAATEVVSNDTFVSARGVMVTDQFSARRTGEAESMSSRLERTSR